MPQEIKTIPLIMPYKLGSVNCYLIKTDDGYILIDSGSSNKRAELENELKSAGCQIGELKLIVITHGDFDHTGNAAYLREKLGAKIAMHADDSGMAEHGDMFWNRAKGNILIKWAFRILPSLFGFGEAERFTPDFCLNEGDDLSEYGLDAKVISIPGHSKGSIGILTADGDLFCGDLLDNVGKSGEPGISSIMDDLSAANASVEKLIRFGVRVVYPGHGKPFPMERLIIERSIAG